MECAYFGCGNRSKELVGQWHSQLTRGMEFDLWGQQVEAVECYSRLAAGIRCEASTSAVIFSDQQKKTLNKVAACVEMRNKSLNSPSREIEITLNQLKSIAPNLHNVISCPDAPFPLSVSSLPSCSYGLSVNHESSQFLRRRISSSTGLHSVSVVEDSDESDELCNGSLLPPPNPMPGHSFVTIIVERIGFKDASSYLEPFITVSVKDNRGRDISLPQDTPISCQKSDTHIFFQSEVHLQQSLESLPEGFTTVFEFKYYKPKKKSTSTKCWAFLERDELKSNVALELYKKPVVAKHKKLHLLSIKPLFLHLKLIVHSH